MMFIGRSFSQETSGRVGSLGLGPSAGSSTWNFTSSQLSSNSMFKQGSDSLYLGNSSSQQYVPQAYEPIRASSPTSLKQEHLFFSEWPTTKESWSNLDNNGSHENAFSSTQLSMSIPRSSSDFASGTAAYSANGESEFIVVGEN